MMAHARKPGEQTTYCYPFGMVAKLQLVQLTSDSCPSMLKRGKNDIEYLNTIILNDHFPT